MSPEMEKGRWRMAGLRRGILAAWWRKTKGEEGGNREEAEGFKRKRTGATNSNKYAAKSIRSWIQVATGFRAQEVEDLMMSALTSPWTPPVSERKEKQREERGRVRGKEMGRCWAYSAVAFSFIFLTKALTFSFLCFKN